jgi:PBSX family phage terminase large subunit
MLIKASNLITPKFHSLWKSRKTFQVAKGGRSSGKSTTIGFKIVRLIMQYKVNALIVRKVAGTLRNSCYGQIKDAIYIMGVGHLFECVQSRLEIVFKPTGQVIMFRGADEPTKVKSIKTAKYPIAIMWIEELADFKEEDEVDTLVDSVVRADIGFPYQVFFSYNPPKRKTAWVNRKYENLLKPLPDTFIHHSTSFDNPFLSSQFKTRAQHMKETKPLFYRWNYLGEPLGGGLVPFNNLVFKQLDTKSFADIRQGLDWGFSIDPLSMVRMNYDKTRRDLYIFGEIYGQKIHNIDLSAKIKAMGWNDSRIIADCSEPSRISDLKNYGVKIIGARKGAGSVESGLEWLDSLEHIYIDPVTAPNTAEEFDKAEYAVDRLGNMLPRLDPSLPDHSIDAVRYGTEDDQIKRLDLKERYR